MTEDIRFIFPDWPAPVWVKAVVTTRQGGVSQPPYEHFNLATHVGDDIATVMENRRTLQQALDLSHEPCWLNQQHTTQIVYLPELTDSALPVVADASWTDRIEQVSVVMTADCLPILVTNSEGTFVCAIHAGWKGLADGIVEASLAQLPGSTEDLMAWIGPAIGAEAFEVGQDVFECFVSVRASTKAFFTAKASIDETTQPKYSCDLVGLAKLILGECGVTQVTGGQWCTYENDALFYSYRRDGQTGRIASLIWLTPHAER